MVCRSVWELDLPREELAPESLPDREETAMLIDLSAARTEGWLRKIDLGGRNTAFPWTGQTNLSVALFLLRHGQYHLGEINALLNDSFSGKAADHFANTVRGEPSTA